MSNVSVFSDPNHQRSRELVLKFGWNSTCYQILNPGLSRWLTADANGLVGYVTSGKTAIVAGSPVCALEDMQSVLDEWEAFAAQRGWKICYFGAEARLQNALQERGGYAAIVAGYQPDWTPASFIQKVNSSAMLRAQLNRARNKRVRVEEWDREQAENNPALKAVLEDWLAHRGLPPLHFLVEPETLGDLRDRRMFVALQDGQAVGFVTLCPAHARNGWLTEQFVRSSRAPNGTIELLLYHAIEAIRNEQSEYVTMGIVPLVLRGDTDAYSEPYWLRAARQWSTAHFNRFYNFRGLDQFKAKFQPDAWQPVVVVAKDSQFGISNLRSIVRAFTIIPPEIALAVGLAKAVRTELKQLRRLFVKRG